MRLLIDMDGVLADFETAFAERWNARHQDLQIIDVNNRPTFKVVDQFPKWTQLIRDIQSERGFFEELPPVAGAVAAMQQLADDGHEVWILTSPLSAWRHCVPEKYAWVEEHLGFEWTRRLVVAKPKWLVHGDRLLDDNPRPRPSSARRPSWEHVVFDAPYNRHRKSAVRMRSWRDISVLTGDWLDRTTWHDSPAGPIWVVASSDHDRTVVQKEGHSYRVRSWIEIRDHGTTFSAVISEHEVRRAANAPSRARDMLMGELRHWTITPDRGEPHERRTILGYSDGYEAGGRGW